MRKRLLRGASWKIGAGVLVGASLAGAVAVYADGGDQDQIHACLTTDAPRPNTIIVGPNDACPPNTTARHWDRGPGPQGAQGPPGPPAPSAALDVQTFTKSSAMNRKTKHTVGSPCPAGTQVVGGGHQITHTAAYTKGIYYSVELNAPYQSAWVVKAELDKRPKVAGSGDVANHSEDAQRVVLYDFPPPHFKWKLTVYAQCAKIG